MRTQSGAVRLQIPRTYLRERASYVSIDFSREEFVEALKAAGLVSVGEVTRTITKTVLVPREVTEEIIEFTVV